MFVRGATGDIKRREFVILRQATPSMYLSRECLTMPHCHTLVNRVKMYTCVYEAQTQLEAVVYQASSSGNIVRRFVVLRPGRSPLTHNHRTKGKVFKGSLGTAIIPPD